MEEEKTLKQRIYSFISSQVSIGELGREERLTEQEIAKKLNVSRTPVRETLFQLAADGILEHTPRKGFRIKKLNQKDAEEIYQLLGVLDAKAAVLACPHLIESDFSSMQFLIDSMNSAIKNKLYTKYNELQYQFHNVYTIKCGNRFLINELEKNKKYFVGNVYCNIDSAKIQEMLYKTNEEHQEIVRLLKENQLDQLREFIETIHWRVETSQYDIW